MMINASINLMEHLKRKKNIDTNEIMRLLIGFVVHVPKILNS